VKFLVLWELELRALQPTILKLIGQMADYSKSLKNQGKLHSQYHVVGRHGGAWIYEVDSNEELERLIAGSPVHNYAQYHVLPLAEMEAPEYKVQRRK